MKQLIVISMKKRKMKRPDGREIRIEITVMLILL